MYYLLAICAACGISQAMLSPFDFVDKEKLAASPYPCPKCHQHSQMRYDHAESPEQLADMTEGTQLVTCALAMPVPKNLSDDLIQQLPQLQQQEDNSWMNF